MTSLSPANNPVGVTVNPPTLFVTFAGPPNDISFYMSTLFNGVGGSGNCFAAAAPGQLCNLPGSAVTFLNAIGGTSSATISAQGFARHASDAGTGFANATPLSMIFTAQFDVPFQSVIAQFSTNHILTSTYSANFAASAVPEPMTMSLVGFSLLALSVGIRRRNRSAK
jgi:hypothetical protein